MAMAGAKSRSARGVSAAWPPTPKGWTFAIEADADALPRLQEVVIDHLKRFAFREDLGAPVWTLVG
jgi:hypothetical protein